MNNLAVCLSAALVLAGAARVVAQSTPPPQNPTGPPAQPSPLQPKPPVPSNIIQRVIVKVNGEIFTQTELVQRQVEALRDESQDVKDPKAFQDDAKLAEKINALTPALLVAVVDELLLVQRGRELGIRFTEENFKQQLENVKKANNLDDEGLKKALVQAGLTLAELRQNFERAYLQRGVEQTEIMNNMRLTEEETRQYYEKHPEAFMKPATLVLREMVVNVPAQTDSTGQPAVNVAADEEAKDKIVKARARVLAGEDFVKVAADVSDAGSKANGGLVGTVVIDEMQPVVRDALAKLKPGEVSEPLRFPTGYRIFKVDARAAAAVEPFDQVRDAIAQKIYQERLGGEMKKYIEKLRAQALIEWKDDGYKQQYEKALLTRGKSGQM
ncbi:MAG TPA: peptidylprolyl isomerase [Vicinamibacterales bacterium]|nr:peptidylprolyl isomerase [Vicinamibacterales bacterium]